MTAYSDYAYPHSERPASQPGMTLRDYFAAAALTGIQARDSPLPNYAAKLAYHIASEMMKERGS